jgi:hypothetical protein
MIAFPHTDIFLPEANTDTISPQSRDCKWSSDDPSRGFGASSLLLGLLHAHDKTVCLDTGKAQFGTFDQAV